jgi:hypothetical protein
MARTRRKRVRVTRISVHHLTFYKSKTTGRFISRVAAREVASERVLMEMQRTERGRFLRATEVLSRKRTLKIATVDSLDGGAPGRIDAALFRTNVTTRLKDVRRYEITIKGRTHRDKEKRIRVVIPVAAGTLPAKAYRYLVFGIVQAMRARGYRTQYNLDEATFSYRAWSKNKSRTLKQLHDVEIAIRLFKR